MYSDVFRLKIKTVVGPAASYYATFDQAFAAMQRAAEVYERKELAIECVRNGTTRFTVTGEEMDNVEPELFGRPEQGHQGA